MLAKPPVFADVERGDEPLVADQVCEERAHVRLRAPRFGFGDAQCDPGAPWPTQVAVSQRKYPKMSAEHPTPAPSMDALRSNCNEALSATITVFEVWAPACQKQLTVPGDGVPVG